MGYVVGDFNKDTITLAQHGITFPIPSGTPVFKFQDRGDGFKDQIGIVPFKKYRPLTTGESVYGEGECFLDTHGCVFYYSGMSEPENSVNTFLADVFLNTYTVYGWFNPTGVASYGDHTMVYGFESVELSPSNFWYCLIHLGGIREYHTPGYTFPKTKEWYHIAFVYFVRDMKMSIYVDGVRVIDKGKGHFGFTDFVSNESYYREYYKPCLCIGNSNVKEDTGYCYKGRIDDLCMFTGDIFNDSDSFKVPTSYM